MSAHKQKGFTLIELLVVITIIAILAVVGFAIYGGAASKAKDAKRRSDIDAIVKAYETKYDPIKGIYGEIGAESFTQDIVPTPPEGEGYDIGLMAGTEAGTYKGFRVCARLENNPAGEVCTQNSATCYCKDPAQGERINTAEVTFKVLLASGEIADGGSGGGGTGGTGGGGTGSTHRLLACENFGDLDNSGDITSNDIQILSSKLLANSLNNEERIIADVNYDGSSELGTVSLSDTQHLSNYLNNSISNLNVCANSKPSPCGSIGDVTGDGKVTEMDTQEALRLDIRVPNSIYTGQPYTSQQRTNADVNASGSVTVSDSALIQRYLAGTITTFSACSITSRPLDCEIYGDIDRNNQITPNDSLMISQHVDGLIVLTDDQKIIADVNYVPGSSASPGTTVNSADALKIQSYIDGLEAHLPICVTTRQVPNPPDNGIGDVSTDGKITYMDVLEIHRIASSSDHNSLYTNQPYTADQHRRADFNSNGDVNSLDGLCLHRFLNSQPATTNCPLQ